MYKYNGILLALHSSLTILHLRSLHVTPFHPGLHPSSHRPVNLSQILVSLQLQLHCLLQFLPQEPATHSTIVFKIVSVQSAYSLEERKRIVMNECLSYLFIHKNYIICVDLFIRCAPIFTNLYCKENPSILLDNLHCKIPLLNGMIYYQYNCCYN